MAASGTNSAISLPSTSTTMSPGSSALRGGRVRNHLLDDEQPGLLRIRFAHARLGIARQPEPPQLGERLVHELRLQRAARHGLAPLDLRERDLDAVERQEEARGSLRVGAGVQRDDAAFDVDDGRARRAARRARRGLQIEGVEVVVVAAAVVRRLAVEPRDRAGEDRELLAGVVADDADVAADLRGLRHELELGRLHELQLARVVAEETEVVHRVAVHRHELDFLLIEEHGLGSHGSRRHDVPVGEDEPALRVDDETRRLARLVALGIERARAVDLNGHDSGRDAFQSAIPTLLLGRERRGRDDQSAEERSASHDSNVAHSGRFYACDSARDQRSRFVRPAVRPSALLHQQPFDRTCRFDGAQPQRAQRCNGRPAARTSD